MPSARPFADLVDRAPPERLGDSHVWSRQADGWQVRFVGRGPERRPETLAPLLPGAISAAWLTQRHTDLIAAARPGLCGVADALEIDTAGIAGVVATADCLPIAVVRGERAVLVHAGWRGLAAGLPRSAAERLRSGNDEAEASAWIGPAIGPCCYEVGEEVAEQVRNASDERVVAQGADERPHLDLRAAAALQLRAAGVERVALVDHCTRCRGDWLWSHRGTGGRAGRNLALLWRAGTD